MFLPTAIAKLANTAQEYCFLREWDIIAEMGTFDNVAFTDKIAARYAQQLHDRLPSVKFMLAKDLIEGGAIRVLGKDTSAPMLISLDEHWREDGSLDEDYITEAISTGLSEPIIAYAEQELSAQTGQLWLVHRPLRTPNTFGACLVHVAKLPGIELFGQAWYDIKELQSMYLARTVWVLARSKKG